MIAGAAPPMAPLPFPGAGVAGVEADGAAGADLVVSLDHHRDRITYEAEEAGADSTGAEADSTGAEADSTGSDSVGAEIVGSAGYSSVAEGTTTSEDEAAGAEADEAAADDEAGAEAEGAGAGAGAEPPPE